MEFDASPATAQAALNELSKSGFTEAKGKLGTFLSKSPPHLHRFAIACFETDETDTRFFKTLREEAVRLQREGWAFDIIDLPRAPLRDKNVKELGQLIKGHHYAGVIFTHPPNHLLDTELVTLKGIPRVILSDDIQRIPQSYGVTVDDSFLDRAVREITARGLKRTAYFLHSFEIERVKAHITFLQKAGLEVPSAWTHAVHYSTPFETRPIVELLFQLPAHKRPETILISDDNLTEEITHALKDFCPASVQPPIFSHCNYPWLPTSALPVHWIGYSVMDMYLQAVRLIENERRGQRNPHRIIRIPARSEEEMMLTS